MIEAVRLIAEDTALDWYMRCQAVEVALDAGLNQGGEALEARIDWIAGMAVDITMEWVFRTWAGYALLDFPRERHRDLMETIAREDELRRIDHPYHQVVFAIDDIERAFADPDPKPQWRDDLWRNPWRFYDPVEIAARQQRWRAEDESEREEMEDDWAEPSVTYVRAMPKICRNDPCPCGSGKKYKRCCLGK
ncbi:MAG: SEC-C metal-binding domain-containing protein [Rhodanobacteraceae bacterium]